MDRKITATETRDALGLAVLVVLFVGAGLVILPVPFTRDQGIYAYNAWRWLGDAMPYRDAFDHKGPALYLVYALGLKLSAGAMWGPNLMDLVARAATVVFTFLAGRRLAGSRAGLFAALFTALPLFGIFNSCWWNAQAETFIMPLLAATVWLAAREGDRFTPAALAIAGLLAGQAVMLKPTAGLHAVYLFGWIWLAENGVRSAGRVKRVLWFGAGLAAGAGAWLGYYAIKGALPALIEVLFVFNFFHAAAPGEDLGAGLVRLGRDFFRIFNFIPLLAAMMLGDPRRGRGRPFQIAVIGFIASGLLQVLAQGKFFPYHWLVLIPALGLAAGAGLERLAAALARWLGPGPARTIAGLILLYLLFTYGQAWFYIVQSYRTRDYLAGRITLAQYYARFNTAGPDGKGDFNLLASAAAADRARQMVPEGQTLLVFGYEPIVNYLAARPAPTRFEIDYPLTFTPASDWSRRKREQWRAEFMRDLQARPPAVVIIVDNDLNRLEPQTSLVQAQTFPDFIQWLNRNYQPDAVIEDFHFYKIKPPAP